MVLNAPMILDYNVARRDYDAYGRYCPDKNKPVGLGQGFGAFSPAYACSNEETARVVKLLKPSGKTALAIAGSGDMPFVLTASGAAHVDTFDVSNHANLVTRVKIGMLQSGMNLKQYRNQLHKVQEIGHFFTNAKMMDIVSQSLNINEIEYLKGMSGCRIVRYTRPQNWFPYVEQYNLMQHKVCEPYNFIRADIHDIFGHIQNNKYDIIYLSNIVQYAGDNNKVRKIVNQMQSHLNPNGVIVLDSLNPMYSGEYDFLGNESRDIIFNAIACSVFVKTR